VTKLSRNFEEIIWRAPGNIEDQNKVLDSSIIIINYFIILINANYNYIINAYYNSWRNAIRKKMWK